MAPTLAARLGFAPDEKVLVVHVDDLGMCHAANEGGFEAMANGPATCGSVMVPCAWFAEAAARARALGREADVGVHLTLNAEWDHYRWGPVAGRDRVPSLLDDDGFLPRTQRESLEHAKPEHVAIELQNCLISSFQTSGSGDGGGIPLETFQLNFTKVKFKYQPKA